MSFLGDASGFFDKLADGVDERRKPLLYYALAALVVSMVVRTQFSGDVARWIGDGILVLATLTFALFGLVVVRTALSSGSPEHVQAQRIGGNLVLGVHAGRRKVEYGVLEITGKPEAPLAGISRRSLLGPTPGSRTLSERPSRDEVFAVVTDTLQEMLGKVPDRCVDAVAIALPGLVGIRERILQTSAGGLPPNSYVSREIAERLLKRLPGVEQTFGLQRGAGSEELARKIYLDNDTRALARYVLADNRDGWRHFVTVLVSEGVGGAWVLDDHLYYGAFTGAGEVGHQCLDLSERGPLRLTSPEGTDMEIPVPDCRCGKAGTHLEMVVNEAGAIVLARGLNPQLFSELEQRLSADSEAPRPLGVELIAAAAASSLGEGGSVPGSLGDTSGVPEALASVIDSDEYRRYFGALLEEYARLLAIGIANLVNIFDLDHVVLTGPVVTAFNRVDSFSRRLRDQSKRYVLREERVKLSMEPGLVEHLWEGAALLVRDPDYGAELARHS